MSHRYVLALDTAMAGCSAAVFDPETGRSHAESMPMARGQSEQLVPMADRVVSDAGIEYADIALIAVTSGPGAFTGLRIGLSAARAFATALDVPVNGVMTTDVLAAMFTGTPEQAGKAFAVILETKRADFYFAIFKSDGSASGEPGIADADALAAMLGGVDCLIGDGAMRFKAEAVECPASVIGGYDLPDPAILAQLAYARWTKGAGEPADPVYLKGADVSIAKYKQRPIIGGSDK